MSFKRLRFGLIFGMLGLAGCVATDAPTPTVYRDQSVIIAATTRFDPVRFSGRWFVREWFPEQVKPTHFDFSKPDAVPSAQSGVIKMIDNNGTKRTLVVLWVNEEFTVAALGSIKGARGYIVTKQGRGQAGTLTAARDVLSFNGYDISKLKRPE